MIRRIINAEWGIDIGEYVIHRWMTKLSPILPVGGRSNSTVLTWLRMRLLEAGPSVFKNDEDGPRITVTLHMFPINYARTDEQRIRAGANEAIPQDATPKPARSKLTRMQAKHVQPVDGLSARVNPGEWDEGKTP